MAYDCENPGPNGCEGTGRNLAARIGIAFGIAIGLLVLLTWLKAARHRRMVAQASQPQTILVHSAHHPSGTYAYSQQPPTPGSAAAFGHGGWSGGLSPQYGTVGAYGSYDPYAHGYNDSGLQTPAQAHTPGRRYVPSSGLPVNRAPEDGDEPPPPLYSPSAPKYAPPTSPPPPPFPEDAPPAHPPSIPTSSGPIHPSTPTIPGSSTPILNSEPRQSS